MLGLERDSKAILSGEPTLTKEPLRWFAVQTRSRHEKKAHAELQEKGIQSFLPLFAEKHKWSDRQRVVEMPLFQIGRAHV